MKEVGWVERMGRLGECGLADRRLVDRLKVVGLVDRGWVDG